MKTGDPWHTKLTEVSNEANHWFDFVRGNPSSARSE
jgi:hypothetical protein